MEYIESNWPDQVEPILLRLALHAKALPKGIEETHLKRIPIWIWQKSFNVKTIKECSHSRDLFSIRMSIQHFIIYLFRSHRMPYYIFNILHFPIVTKHSKNS